MIPCYPQYFFDFLEIIPVSIGFCREPKSSRQVKVFQSISCYVLLFRKSGDTYHFIIEFRQVPVKFRLRNNKTPSTQFFCSIYEGSKGELTDSRKGLFFDEFPSSSPPSQSSFSENFLRNCPILIPPLLTSCAVENKGKAIVVLKHHYLI